MCSLVRYHEHLFCQFPFTKCLYFLNLSCISASAFIHLLCYCIKYQTYQNICMNQLFPSTRITTLSASQDASMIDLWLVAHIFHEKSIWPWIHFPSWYASSFGRFFHWGLLFQSEFIPIRKNPPPEIIFSKVNSSPFGRIFLQGLFSQGEFIPIQKNLLPRIIFPRWIHPHSEESSSRDYFPGVNSSLFRRIRLQGCLGNIKVSAMAAKAN